MILCCILVHFGTFLAHFHSVFTALVSVGASYVLSSLHRNLAIGIGIQNFPEGLAVSLPLKAAGVSTLRSFW